MRMNNVIIQLLEDEIADSAGGFTTEQSVKKEISCNISVVMQPEMMNQYGQRGEQIIHAMTNEPLLASATYLFNDKKYTLRASNPMKNQRLFSAILVEIK